jgi:hypothetical protein
MAVAEAIVVPEAALDIVSALEDELYSASGTDEVR